MKNSPFKITTYKFNHCNFNESNDFHCIYILENSKYAYIGETLRIKERINEHRKKFQKYDFERIHVITNDDMEETPAKHFEMLFIKLMKIDGKFKIINKLDGNKTNYKRKIKFEPLFDKIWDQLLAKELVKTKKFKFIMNLNSYKYSPYVDLNDEQTNALTHVINVLNSGETDPYQNEYKRRPILIQGGAGTGKTVVATSLFHYLKNHNCYKNKKIGLVVADKHMRDILKDIFKNVKDGIKKTDVISPIELTKQKYDIIICDETHALRRCENLVSYKKNFQLGNKRLGLNNNHDELDWILNQSDYQILFYDPKQCVRHSDIRDLYVKERIENDKYREHRPIELTTQMRVEAGKTYIDYIYDIFYQKAKKKISFKNYHFKLFLSFKEMRKKISDKDEQYELSKLCAGYAWKWISKNDNSSHDIVIQEEKLRWNNYKTTNWVKSEESKYTMGSLYTLRGIDLNYSGVVIGPDLYFDKNDNEIKVNKKSLYSNDVKRNATDEEILKYVIQTYAILLTRAIKGTYVYVFDDDLREYLSFYIDTI